MLTVGGLGGAAARFGVSIMAGFVGSLSALKGARTAAQAGHKRAGHVGSDEQRLHEVLRNVGSKSALTLVRSTDQDVAQAVAEQAAARASDSWQGSRAEFLAASIS